jgi:hypothetical protein
MTGTTTSHPRMVVIDSPKRVLAVMAAALAVSAAIAFGPWASNDSAVTAGVVDPRVDYAIRHLNEGGASQALSRTADYALRHLEPSISRTSDYALRHLDG